MLINLYSIIDRYTRIVANHYVNKARDKEYAIQYWIDKITKKQKYISNKDVMERVYLEYKKDGISYTTLNKKLMTLKISIYYFKRYIVSIELKNKFISHPQNNNL